VEVVGPEPVNTTAEPPFLSGLGTKDDPFLLKSVIGMKPGSTVRTTEVITISHMTPEIEVNLLDLNEVDHDKRFKMHELNPGSDELGYQLKADQEGGLQIRLIFDDSIDPTLDGKVYRGLIKLGMASVYFSWTVSIEGERKDDTEVKTDKTAGMNLAEAMMDDKAQAEADVQAAKEVKAQAEADAQTAKEVKAQAEADARAAKEVKAQAEADARAAKEVKAQAEADARAAKDVKAQADADARAAKEVKAQADEDAKTVEIARAQVEADAAAVAKKAEELERIAKRAKDIDFATLGVASASNGDDLQMIKGVGPFIAEKLNALGIFTFEQVGNMTAEIEEQVNVAIEFFPGRVKRDEWAKQGKELSEN
jgi:predicted flap endonuclease-1-like 5' DNA nuclease